MPPKQSFNVSYDCFYIYAKDKNLCSQMEEGNYFHFYWNNEF
jgi:hypothetical protein